MNLGLLYFFAISGLTVVGLMAGGWSSFNKYSLLGGLRAAAQIVSYELPLLLAPVGVIMLAGTMSLNQIVENQAGWFWDWYVFQQPLAFIVFFIAATAEGNRTPFDLTEADSEIVAGFATEYSGMRFGFFFFAEYVSVFILSALTVVLFFGGWNSPIDPQPILDWLNITINPALDLAGMGIWLLWALVIGVPLLILLLDAADLDVQQRLVVPQVARRRASSCSTSSPSARSRSGRSSRSRSSSACSGSRSRCSRSCSSSCGCAARCRECASTS